jgi:hypothetical protein
MSGPGAKLFGLENCVDVVFSAILFIHFW